MISDLKDLDLDSLKKNHTRLYYFGLGFIQLKLDETQRLHFYSPKLPAITEDIHNHRYGFLSKILKGHLINWTYEIGRGDDYKILDVSCDPLNPAPEHEEYVNTNSVVEDDYTDGESYVMTPSMYHRVKAEECITLLTRTHKTKEFAQIILPIDGKPVCPYSKKVEDKELWKIIEEMI